ncbi:MAG TPA: SLBB domain-containing protein, partial [Candidatus Dormibacteraeota bacterium]|nr:SLBB domain-containing protein [Candidatus Dormibacteraeota bacterium]
TYISPKYSAEALLLRDNSFKIFDQPPLSPETFAGLLRSPELLKRVGEKTRPPILPEQLSKTIKIDPQPDSDLVKLTLSAPDPHRAVNYLNTFAEEAVAFTSEYNKQLAGKLAHDYLDQQVQAMDKHISSLREQFRAKMDAHKPKTNSGTITTSTNQAEAQQAAIQTSPQVISLKQRLQTELGQLDDLLLKYTEIHPFVQAERDRIAGLKSQLTSALTNSSLAISRPSFETNLLANIGMPPTQTDPEADMIRLKLLSLEEIDAHLLERLNEAMLYATNPPAMASINAPASEKTLKGSMHKIKIGLASVFGGGVGFCATLGLLLLVELADKRMRGREDLKRVTKLPVLTTLGDLRKMSPADRAQWAFRTWTILQGRLSPSANHGLVCGITSCGPGEGRSTWISLLAEAASLTGFRVLTIATKPSGTFVGNGEAPSDNEEPEAAFHMPNSSNGTNGAHADREHGHNGSNGTHAANGSNGASHPMKALVNNVLTTPAKVTEQLTGPNSQPVVHIPLPGWVWNLERRKQWRDALNHWRTIENLVILVELPPASVAEAVLLGSNLPNLVWLAQNGRANAADTREQLEMLRHARCNLVGAVLNREDAVPMKKRFPRWLGCIALPFFLSLSVGHSEPAEPPQSASSAEAPSTTIAAADQPVDTSADASTNAVTTPRAFSIVSPAQRAAWQQHLTLGPGDVINLGLFGQPEVTQNEVSIPPDGMLNYLEATNVLATGLTIDELRARMDKQLGEFRRAPRTLITPVSFRSKRYYVLGKVMTKGVYVLDRPITVLEAIARAHGLENGLVDRNIIELADFQRSFLARGGKRFPLDFEKLFEQGDLSQNIPIEPGDYLYFPGTGGKELYVVGEVRLPGVVNYTPETTIMAAISARGGYTERAYKARVLVIRGSLNNPERFAVDTHAILDAKAMDFRLKPRDIIYVNSRPFIRVEELADAAATAFIQALITEWVGVSVVKPISQ